MADAREQKKRCREENRHLALCNVNMFVEIMGKIRPSWRDNARIVSIAEDMARSAVLEDDVVVVVDDCRKKRSVVNSIL